MGETIEHKGQWWLSNQPDRKITGKMVFVPSEGTKLYLDGMLGRENSSRPLSTIDCIHGETNKGKLISLFSCFETSLSGSGSNQPESSIFSNRAFVGGHFFNEDDITLNSLSAEYSFLEKWVNLSGFTDTWNNDGNYDLTHSKVSPVKIFDEDGLVINIMVELSSVQYGKKTRTLEEKTYIKFEVSGQISYNDFLRYAYLIEQFLSIAIKHPIYIGSVNGYMKMPLIENSEDKLPQDYGRNINIIEILLPHRTASSNDELKHYDYLLRFSDIKDDLPSYLQKWFEREKILQPVYNLYFATIKDPDAYQDNKFLNYIHAIESFHRRTENNFQLSKDNHNSRMDEILSSSPAQHKNWLKEELAFSNEPSLAMRLKDIREKYLNFMPDFLDEKAIKLIRDTRNYFTHYNERLRNKAAKGIGLVKLNSKVKIICEILLLSILGLNNDELKKIVLSNWNYKRELEWISKG